MCAVTIAQGNESDILGVWVTESKDAKIKIYKSQSQYFGKVVWIRDPLDENGKPVVDSHNPKDALQSRPILGLNIITNMTFSNKEWSGGKIYDPKNGESYTCKLWFDGSNLKVRGYVGWFFDTKTWTKN